MIQCSSINAIAKRQSEMSNPASTFALSRRTFLSRYAGCLGGLALSQLLTTETHAGVQGPLAPKEPHHKPRAKAVICLFQHGGPSQMDLFDHKPELTKRHGQQHPGPLEIHFHTQVGKLLASPFKFQRSGKSGMELSELLPHTAKIVDDVTLVRSMTTDSVDHEAALRVIHAGKTFPGRPAWGSWVLYGLGSVRQDLPAYVVLDDPLGLPINGVENWESGFLPPLYQGNASARERHTRRQPSDAGRCVTAGPKESTALPRRAERCPPGAARSEHGTGSADQQL